MKTKGWTVIAAAVVMLAAIALTSSLREDPMQPLVSATPRNWRRIEARLTGGFAWAPMPRVTRGSAQTEVEPGQSRLTSAAWSVVEKTGGDHSPRARHTHAVAVFLTGREKDALALLEELTADPGVDASVWSDLAAMRFSLAGTQDGHAALLAEALAAADTALRIDSTVSEALFNRALILERLGVRDSAREAWEKYAATAMRDEWAKEARLRARSLAAIPSFRKVLDTKLETLAADAEAARALAATHPQDARRWGETMILGDWAEAEKAGNRVVAEKRLHIARAFGEQLRVARGEGMLAAAVAAIDRSGAEARRHLIEAHILFRAGQKSFMADRAAEAQSTLMRAARGFELGGSPLALVAEYLVAHTFHALGNLPEAREREKRMLATAPAGFPAHRAQLLWHIGLGYMSDGQWGRAMTALNESIALFESLGETEFATTVRGLIADIYDRTGDPEAAWAQRIIVLRQIGRSNTSRLQLTLDSISRGAIARREWPVAASFLHLAGDVAARIDRPLIEVETRVLQARALAETRNTAAAGAAISAARLAASRVDDPAVRENAMADVLATEAIIAPSPREAIALLTEAIEYHRTRGRRIRLPDMLLHRGRAFREIGDADDAAADFETGITELEKHRESLPEGSQRWDVFAAANELFEEAVALSFARGDVEGAFGYTERARARELLETLGAPGTQPPAAYPPDVALIEYAALPNRLLIFVADRDGVRAVEIPLRRSDLEREIEQFIASIGEETPDMRARGAALHRRLIGPVQGYLGGKDTIVFVPGPSLAAMPFPALVTSRGDFLVEDYTLLTAPSAAIYRHLVTRPSAQGERRRLLALANPAMTGDFTRLPGAEAEAKQAGARYRQAMVLTDELATPAAFARNAPAADVIHLATHGVVPAGDRGSAALLLAGGQLDVTSIAALRLKDTDVVVLAACSTARGTPRAEGTISVARAFLAAGVPTVVASLWPIDDAASAQFFPPLHNDLARGVSAGQALRAAQINSIRRRESPALWAAMQCFGR